MSYVGMTDWCTVGDCTAPIINGTPLCHHIQEEKTMNTPKPQAAKPLAFTPPINKTESFKPIKNDGKNRPLADHPGLAKLRSSK